MHVPELTVRLGKQ